MFLRYAQMGPQGDALAVGPRRQTAVPPSTRIH
jgi:hypothetical protein